MLEFVDGTVQHTWREGNPWVDMLANVVGLKNEGLVILENPLDCVKEFLYADMTGVCRPRL